MSKFHFLFSFGLLCCAIMASACSPEEYGPCSIPNTVGHQVACSPIGSAKTATCAADYVFDCDSFICGIYESSSPFCTHRCVPSESECNTPDKKEFCERPKGKNCKTKCPEDAASVEWIKGTSAYYCLPTEYQVVKSTASTSEPNTSTSEPNTSSSEGQE